MSPEKIHKLVSRAGVLRSEIAIRQEELDGLTAQIVALGKGKYAGDGAACAVIEVSEGKPSYKLGKDNEDQAREIAGEFFAKVFDRKTTFEPCASFADVVLKLLPKAASRKLIALCEKPGKAASAYLKWDK